MSLEERFSEERASHRENFHNLNSQVGEASIQATKMMFISNGGALVALLGFLSFFADRPSEPIAVTVALSLSDFAVGTIFSLIVAVTAYATNYCYVSYVSSWEFVEDNPYPLETNYSKRWIFAGKLFHVTSVAAGLGSIVFFVLGVWELSNVVSYFG